MRLTVAALLALIAPQFANAFPAAPGYQVSIHASIVDPVRLSAAPGGVLYVGRDSSGSGGSPGAHGYIRRLGAGGAPMEIFGLGTTPDPDAVQYDGAGLLGTPGAVLVGGLVSDPTGGHITAIHPDESLHPLFGPVTTWHNPSDFAIDMGGRVLFTNFPNPLTSSPGVFVISGGPPTLLFGTSPRPFAIAVDSGNRIFVAFEDGTLRSYNSAGAVLNPAFATGLRAGAPLAIGSLSGAVEAIYTVNAANQLIRISLSGTPAVMGSGFESTSDFEFGDSGVLYMSEFANDRVLRLVRATPAASPAVVTLLLLALAGAGAALIRRRHAEYVSSR